VIPQQINSKREIRLFILYTFICETLKTNAKISRQIYHYFRHKMQRFQLFVRLDNDFGNWSLKIIAKFVPVTN